MPERMVGNGPMHLADVARYYSAKLAEHGDTAHGVDWNGEESQVLRFDQLVKVIQRRSGFSVNDLGCGYGALLDYLTPKFERFSYHGTDISPDMIRAARARHPRAPDALFAVTPEPTSVADYGIASGIFNVRLDSPDTDWERHIESTLDLLDRTSRESFAFNCLTKYSDDDRRRSHLYYADPCALFDLCKRKYSRQVALLHDYGLYEFTLLVRKQP
jgi:SAM-dependent methyltransferase